MFFVILLIVVLSLLGLRYFVQHMTLQWSRVFWLDLWNWINLNDRKFDVTSTEKATVRQLSVRARRTSSGWCANFCICHHMNSSTAEMSMHRIVRIKSQGQSVRICMYEARKIWEIEKNNSITGWTIVPFAGTEWTKYHRWCQNVSAA